MGGGGKKPNNRQMDVDGEVLEDGVLRVLAYLSAHDPGPGAGRESLLSLLAGAAAGMPGVAGAGVMWEDGSRLRHAAGTDEVIAALQRAQEDEQAGPSVDAWHGAVTVTVDRLPPAQGPGSGHGAGRAGHAPFAAVPVMVGGRAAGVLGVWGRTGGGWQADHLTVLALLCDVVGNRLARESEYQLLARTGGDLRHALQGRVLIEQAKGMLAGQRGVSVDRALTMMRSHARNRGQTLRSVAGAVVAGRLRI